MPSLRLQRIITQSGYDELIKRDKVNLDIFWLKDKSLEDSDDLPQPDVLAQEIADDLQTALELFAGIAKAGKKDRAAIRDAVMQTKDFDGALGKWSFDDNGDTTNTAFSGSQVQKKDGKLAWNFVTTLEAPK